jgi:hypothetical protein
MLAEKERFKIFEPCSQWHPPRGMEKPKMLWEAVIERLAVWRYDIGKKSLVHTNTPPTRESVSVDCGSQFSLPFLLKFFPSMATNAPATPIRSGRVTYTLTPDA